MKIDANLLKAYFNYSYNTVYDFTTARLSIYRNLHEKCVGKLEFKNDDRVLCVGLGTGNEILRVLDVNRNVSITGVDYSSTGLRKAHLKALRAGKEINLVLMDARYLDFESGSFDKVLCVHVTDFILDSEKVVGEIARVLKPGGQFVITYPSQEEGTGLVANIFKDSFHHNVSSRNYVIGFFIFLGQMLLGMLYIPLLLRKKRGYSVGDLQVMFTEWMPGTFQIEEYPTYQDFIVYGAKSTEWR